MNLTPSGPPETILDSEPPDARAALEAALAAEPDAQRAMVSAVVAQWPRYLDAWARLGDLARDEIEAYSAYRVGYHRGLDRLRQNGWRGSGFVRWQHPQNQGFLRALAGLARCAGQIREDDEALRCSHFLKQLEPAWPPADFSV